MADSIYQHLIDPQETSATCVRSVRTIINAFTWSPETEALCIKQITPVAEMMHRISVEFQEILSGDDPKA